MMEKASNRIRIDALEFKIEAQALIDSGQLLVFSDGTINLTPICQMQDETELRKLCRSNKTTEKNKDAIEKRVLQITKFKPDEINLGNKMILEKWAKTLPSTSRGFALVGSEKAVIYQQLKKELKCIFRERASQSDKKMLTKKYNKIIINMICYQDEFGLINHVKAGDKAARETGCVLFIHALLG